MNERMKEWRQKQMQTTGGKEGERNRKSFDPKSNKNQKRRGEMKKD
jgi:hypothetical protein